MGEKASRQEVKKVKRKIKEGRRGEGKERMNRKKNERKKE
jgi:hypothetical protein